MSNLLNEYNLIALGLTYLLHSSVWILVVAAILKGKSFRSPFMINALWKVALVGGIVTTYVAMMQSNHQLEFNKPVTEVAQNIKRETNLEALGDQQAIPVEVSKPGRQETITIEDQLMLEGANGVGQVKQTSPKRSLISFLPWAWAIGILLVLFYRLAQHFWFFKQLGHRKEIENPTVLHIIESIQRRTKRPIQWKVSASPFLDSPIVIRGKEICLPSKALAAMNEDQLKAMIAHEWAHIIRRDHHWALFICLLNTLFFFQPLHRLAKQQIDISNELLCDEQAARLTGNALALAECLVAVASWIKPNQMKPVLVAGMALRKSELSSRITQLLNIPDMKIQRFRKLKLSVPSLLLLALTLLVLPGFRFITPPSEVPEQVLETNLISTLASELAQKAQNIAPVSTVVTASNASFGDEAKPAVSDADAVEEVLEASTTQVTLPAMQGLSSQPIDEVQSLQQDGNNKPAFQALPVFSSTKKASCADLLRAVKAGDVDQVRALLKSVDPDCSYYDEGEPRSSLVAAARKGDIEIAKLLLGAKANVEYKARGDESPLMAAANYGHLDLVKLLVASGAKVNRKISGDGTALIGAARGGHYEVAKFLLEKGANPFAMVAGDEYAMYHARMNEDKAMIKLLRSFEDKE